MDKPTSTTSTATSSAMATEIKPIPMTYLSFTEETPITKKSEPVLSLVLLKTYSVTDEDLLDAVFVDQKTVMVAGVKK